MCLNFLTELPGHFIKTYKIKAQTEGTRKTANSARLSSLSEQEF